MSDTPPERKILLVEDSEDDVFFFRRSLKRTGIQCDFAHASNGGAATAYLQEHQDAFYIVFLDLKIPVLNGFEVLKWIQAQPFKDKLEIIILSGSDDPRDVSSARELGISDYLVKPVSVEDLTRKIKTWLAK
ncbi:MAG TPA: response regulator [Verrucomicrobiae bacterium]|nr:response regulator [Verrucomicrobiae bacterium]